MGTPSAKRGCGVLLALAGALVAGACGARSTSGQAAPTAGPTSAAPATTAATTGPAQPPGPSRTPTAGGGTCVSFRPGSGFYEAGRVRTEQLSTPTSGCTTISVSDIRDPANTAERCKTFLVGFWPLVNGSLTYTDPVTACAGSRTVLARNVPDDARYTVLYESGPGMPRVEFTVWH